MKAHVLPLPLVPAMWITFRRFRSDGCEDAVLVRAVASGRKKQTWSTYGVAEAGEVDLHLLYGRLPGSDAGLSPGFDHLKGCLE